MKARNLMAGVAAAGLAFAPIAAHAGTRSSEASVSFAPIAADASRMASPVEASDEALGKIPLWVILFLIALGITLEELIASPGIFD